MSATALVSNLIRRGKQVFEDLVRGTKQAKAHKIFQTQRSVPVQTVAQIKTSVREGKLQYVWRSFIPRFNFNGVAARTSRRAAWRRDGTAMLMAFNTGLILAKNKDEEEITNFVQNLVKDSQSEEESLFEKVKKLSIDQFELGRHIGQGSNAAVYEARLKDDDDANKNPDGTTERRLSVVAEEESTENNTDIDDSSSDITVLSYNSQLSDEDDQAPILFQVDDKEAEEFFLTCDTFSELSDSDISFLDISDADMEHSLENLGLLTLEEIASMDDEDLFDTSYNHGNGNQGENTDGSAMEYASLDSLGDSGAETKFNLALKMMFNYHVESNADAITRAMGCEAVPSLMANTHGKMGTWQNGNKAKKKSLPHHPNIVEMWGTFVDDMPQLSDANSNYPAALPPRINPDGIGRNMTMFLVMKKYQTTLQDYISVVSLSMQERLLLLAQLLEGVAHMNRYSVAHRDIKSNNILLDTDVAGPPQLVISDFGCCLADKCGLSLPYPTDQIDRGGNTALMAPEIARAEPGRFTSLNYQKADLWAVGAIAYEILGSNNPFYRHDNKGRLDSRDYKEEELPPLPGEVPALLRELINSMLRKDPSKRPSARLAADVIHLLLWTPSHWLEKGHKVSRSLLRWWIINMATEVHFGKHSTICGLKKIFLRDYNVNRLFKAFGFCGVEIGN